MSINIMTMNHSLKSSSILLQVCYIENVWFLLFTIPISEGHFLYLIHFLIVIASFLFKDNKGTKTINILLILYIYNYYFKVLHHAYVKLAL